MTDIFKIINQDSSRTDIRITGYIGGWTADPEYVRDQLEQLGEVKDIYVCLQSSGGSALHGTALYTALKNHPANIHINIEAIAASAGFTVAMAASPGMLSMEETALAMIHEASVEVKGTAEDLRNAAILAEKVNETVAIAISGRSGTNLSKEQAAQAMSQTSWYTAQEASEAGLVDQVVKSDRDITQCAAVNKFDFSVYQNVPELLNRAQKSASNDGKPVTTVENDMSKYTQAELDEAVKNAEDCLMERVKKILSHPKATNKDAAILQITSATPIEDALKMMDFVAVENAVPAAEDPKESECDSDDDDKGIKNLVAEQMAAYLSKIQNDSNVDLDHSDADSEKQPTQKADEELGAEMAEKLMAGGLH